MDSVLRRLPLPTDPKVLVGFNTNDDAGVYLLDERIGLVQTVDFFTPVVDDPFTFGQIAAANSLSDVYAMGGRPISALSLVGFPEKGDPEILEAIIRGGLDKMKEANCPVIGGHSIRNDEIQFGYSVSGVVAPDKIWRNVGAKTNDVLLLTKAIGTGVLSTALKREKLSAESQQAMIASMATLNRLAAEALLEVQMKHGGAIHAVTDVTGFGLMGHGKEMASGDKSKGDEGVTLEIDHARVPLLPGALAAVREEMIPGGLKNNREYFEGSVEFAAQVSADMRTLLFDPQTSGGLLVAIDPAAAEEAEAAMQRRGVAAHRIGRVLAKGSARMRVI